MQAAEYYLQVKAANPDAKISFTGHSLGGGLAALMGVFFDETAVTFDQAPFRNSANFIVASALRNALALEYSADTYPELSTWLAPLDRFIWSFDPLGLGWSEDGLAVREGNVTGINVEGELLTADIPFSFLSGIGEQTPLTHGITDVSGSNLHAQSLLTAFLQSDQNAAVSGQTLREATRKLTDLLGMIFDRNLYYNDPNNKNNPKVNFLEHLIQHEFGNAPGVTTADHMLDRFTTDLWKIAQDGGLTMADKNLTDALIAFAMQAYYDNRPASNATLFDTETGGIHFDRMDVADTLAAVKGYAMYFTNYLATLPANDRAVVVAQLPDLLDWYIQAGNRAMNATAGTQRAFMLGGSGDDILTGGSQADLLVGNGGMDTLSGGGGNDTLCGGNGADTLNGGAGADLMIGGEGMDTYYLEGNDTIRDTGRNIIVYQGQVIAGAFLREGTSNIYSFLGDNNFTLTFDSAAHLTVNTTDSITFEQQTSAADFENGDFGITLYDSVEADRTLTGTEERDWVTVMQPGYNTTIFGFWGGGGEISGENIYNNLGYFGFFLPSTPGDTKIYGQGGNDLLYGLSGSDYIDGGDGDDVIRGEMIYNNLYGEMGIGDILLGGNGKDVIVGSSGKDLVSGGEDSDFLDGYAANDTITGDGGDDVLAGGAGDDQLLGGAGNDYLCGDASLSVYGATHSILMNSTAYEYWDADVFTMGFNVTYDERGYAISVALQGFDLPVYGTGSDQLFGGIGNDVLIGAGGNDILMGETDHDRLEGGEGDDYLDGGDGNDLLLGSGGADTMLGGMDDDQLYGDSSDTPADAQGDDYLDGGVGNDILVGSGGADTLLGGIGDDQLHGDSSDTPFESQGGDILAGGNGDDVLMGYGGNDILTGGVGVDYLDGGSGDDTYTFATGDSPMVLDGGFLVGEWIDDREGINTLALPSGYPLQLYYDGYGLTLQYGLDDYLYLIDGLLQASHYNVDTGAGAVSLRSLIAQQIDVPLFLEGNAADDVLQGGWNGDVLIGNDGNDLLDGGAGDDTLAGGTGNDQLYGGAGNNTYLFNRGDGQDTIVDAEGFDIVSFGADILSTDILVDRSGDQLILQLKDTGDQLTVAGYYAAGVEDQRIEQLTFANGEIWDQARIQAMVPNHAPILTTPLVDQSVIEGEALTCILPENAFSDPDTDDTLTYTATMADGASLPDWLSFNPSTLGFSGTPPLGFIGTVSVKVVATDPEGLFVSDLFNLEVRAQNPPLLGASGDDTLTGTAGNDIFQGGAGNDLLTGGAGNDTYLFNPGDGVDRIVDSGGTDTVQFGAGITPDSLALGLGSLLVRVGDQGEAIHLEGFNPEDPFNSSAIEKFRFADGTVLGIVELLARGFDIQGSGGDDLLSGTAATDRIVGGDGADTLSGGAGNDSLVGGSGDDTYMYGRGDDNDVIIDAAGHDRLVLGDDLLLSDFVASLDYDTGELTLGVINETDKLRAAENGEEYNPDPAALEQKIIIQDFRSLAGRLENFGFSDGTSLTDMELYNHFFTSEGDDVISGLEGDNQIFAKGGNDNIALGYGNHLVDAGAGDDTISGGTGNDTFIFSLGGGHDLIHDQGGLDSLLVEGIPGDISPEDFWVERVGNDVIVELDDGSTACVKDWALTENKVENIRFGDKILAIDELLFLRARNYDLALDEDTGISGTIVLGNAGDGVTFTVAQDAGNGSFAVNNNGSWTYTPNGDYSGTDRILVKVANAAGEETISTIDLTIHQVNDAPRVENDSALLIEDLVVSASDNVLANDSGGDAGTTLSVVTSGEYVGRYGTLSIGTDGGYIFSLDNESGEVQSLAEGSTVVDQFTYGVSDGIIAVSGKLEITVTGSNDTPVVVGDSAFLIKDMVLSASGNVLVNDSDVDAGTTLSVVTPGEYAGRYGILSIAVDGGYTYSLDNESSDVQSLPEGSMVVDQFTYGVSDGTIAVSGNLDITVTVNNDAPLVAVGDSAFLIEDMVVSASGNVLVNDSGGDAGTTLAVADPANRLDSYGTLCLTADGSYAYTLDNASGAVQSLGRGAVVAKHFSYTATDGIVSVTSALDITLIGSNDAPILAAPLADQQVNFNKGFSWQLPVGSFVDPDQGDTLDYSATLADGSPLPPWLAFDAATQTFSGRAPKQIGAVEVKVTATDKVAATGNTEGSLSASDLFRITISHGNEGVGNGEDAPPSGHDGNCNDGPGTGPGTPGRRRDHDEYRSSGREGEWSGDLVHEQAWGQSHGEQPVYLNASHWDDIQATETAKGGEQVDPSVVFGCWLTMDLAVSTALADRKTLSWLDERLGADTTALNRVSTGFLGSTTPFGADLFSLQAGHGQELTGFNGLGDGLWKVA